MKQIKKKLYGSLIVYSSTDTFSELYCQTILSPHKYIKGRSPSNGKLSDFPSILIAKNLLTGSLKNRSIDNLETQKKSISMKKFPIL
jgi:hypothetical protein